MNWMDTFLDGYGYPLLVCADSKFQLLGTFMISSIHILIFQLVIFVRFIKRDMITNFNGTVYNMKWYV